MVKENGCVADRYMNECKVTNDSLAELGNIYSH